MAPEVTLREYLEAKIEPLSKQVSEVHSDVKQLRIDVTTLQAADRTRAGLRAADWGKVGIVTGVLTFLMSLLH